MTELYEVFERLGLLQYLDRFIDEGFDTWEIVLYATESDLEALGVKLGHRRKLQKEISETRGISIEHIIGAPNRTASTDDLSHGDFDTRSITSHGDGHKSSFTAGTSKRKYRRHPKPDENAPERAPSAYVIFSNKTREDLKPQKLSFTDIAKTVGERWQLLGSEEKEQCEAQAAAAKEQYNIALAKYKRTSQYREYQRYLAEFKARNTPPTFASTGTKRPKLETEVSGASSSGGSVNAVFNADHAPQRKDSTLNQPAYSPPMSSAMSPTAATRVPSGSRDSSVQSSVPTTPVNAVFPPPPPPATTAAYGTGTRGYADQQAHSLSRLPSLETRDSRPSISSLMTDSAGITNPRRTGVTSTSASLLRQDTSKSSIGSILSSQTSASSVHTPITPIEEARATRSLPSIPALLHHGSSGESGSSHEILDRRQTLGLPGRFAGDLIESTSKPNLGYSNNQSFGYMSLNPEHRDAHYTAQGHHIDSLHLPARHSLPPLKPSNLPHHSDTMSTDRLDSLSVLALAGRMVDRGSTNPTNPNDPTKRL